ncbi:HAMP domain-containing sensor histidine kinase [Amycolatopsis aidingensis]|uniref:HAMP domain-containing sensor histidine kinase n=1 Tax=Amycolatopsis aidingensis TaxID=2842453 RepID=UPI001C0B60D5|nr:HAMP domain-containing sensor histidine kinase [Amycolatopsis aidingensis]
MSSNRRGERARRPWSLRGRLLVQVLGLLALVSLVVGVVTEFALRDFLLDQLDSQLAAASDRGPGGPDRLPPPPGLGFYLRVPGQPVGTVAARLLPGGLSEAARLAPDTSIDPLEREQREPLERLPADGRPRTVTLGDLGDYRAVATGTPEGRRVTALPLAGLHDTLWRLGFVLGGVAVTALLAAGAIAALTVRRTLRPLDRLATTAGKVAEIPLDRGEVALSVRVPEADTDTRTEVGKVGAALNRMLEHVAAALAARQRSESRVRQFVADASHELRTPLASIRGYAELSRRHGEAVPPDVRYALARVEAESGRMTSLVEELLLLARLDSGRPVAREPVDLSRLVADAVADAHVAGPEHRWLLTAPPEPVTVLGDASQLHQVVLNLLNNARTHTPAGTTVRTILAAAKGEVRLAVADDGPGIPAEIRPEVFERFSRGDTSRSREAGSTGLGLAIVAAVVAAHHGQVRLDTHPGRTEFTVILPAHSSRTGSPQ